MDVNSDQSGSPEVDIADHEAPDSGAIDNEFVDQGDGGSDEGQQNVDDSEDVEYEGKQYRLPKELKEALLRQSDYTRKTQEAAEQRKAAEELQRRVQYEQQQFHEAAQRQRANLQAYAQVEAMNQQLAQFQQVNWQQLNAENPVEAQRLFIQQTQIKDRRDALAHQISQHEQHAAFQQQQMTAQRMEQARQALTREIKDWSPQKQAALMDFGKRAGYSEAELSSIQDHRAVLVLHKAWQYDQMMQKASQKPAATNQAAPLKVVSSGNGSSINPNDMSMDQWVKYEQKRLAKKRS